MANLADAIRKSVPRVMRVGTGGSPEPTEQNSLREAMRIREEIIGAKMMSQAYDDLERDSELKRVKQDAELMKAKADELEATIKLEEMRAKTGGGNGISGDSPPPWMVMLNSLVENMQGQNAALIQEVKEARESVLSQTLDSLKSEIASLKTQTLAQGATHTRADEVEGFLSRVEDVRKAIEILKGFSPQPTELAGMQGDFQTIMMLRNMNDNMILRMEELKDRRDQVSWERAMERERLNMEERRSLRMAKTIEQYAPVISALASDKLGIPLPEPSTTATSQPACPNCNTPLVMSTDSSVAFCPQCAQSYKVSGE